MPMDPTKSALTGTTSADPIKHMRQCLVRYIAKMTFRDRSAFYAEYEKHHGIRERRALEQEVKDLRLRRVL